MFSYEKVVIQFGKLSQYSKSNYSNDFNNLMEYLKSPYIYPYCKESIEAMEEFKLNNSGEMSENAIEVPENKVLRLTYVLVTMERVKENGHSVVIQMALQFGKKNIPTAYLMWYNKIADDIITDLLEDIHFKIRSLEDRKENRDKELEDIPVSTTNYHIHGTTYNSQFGNHNIQNININNLFGEIVDSEVNFSEDNRELIQREVKNIENEIKKPNPSREKQKDFLSKIYNKGGTEAIKYLVTKLQYIPAVTTSIMDLLKLTLKRVAFFAENWCRFTQVRKTSILCGIFGMIFILRI
ncbi:hypothetical protein [Salinicoccus roseus]|uniref:hypothetical protein n=1 Tax=Salinicoccus roseus TaxID=45670 RepID=UPI003DA028A1